MASFTSPAEFQDAYNTLFRTFDSGKTKLLTWRKWQLQQMWWMIVDNEDSIVDALKKDLNRHTFETYSADLLGIKRDILEHIRNLEDWAADERPKAGLILGTLSKARVRREPLGVALIIAPWNFPMLLLFQPLIAAITAGCAVMLKPSELAVESEKLVVRLVNEYLDPEAVRIVTGGPAETSHILEHRFNPIFFTGSGEIAQYVATSAAKFLTPTVLELGGQGPAIVTKTANVDIAAKRVAFAKFFNAGQICLTVNHCFVDPDVHDRFVQRLGYWFDQYLAGPKDGYSKIINGNNFDRLTGMLRGTDGRVVYGGSTNRDEGFLHPSIVTGVTRKDALLQEELFGPIVPIIKANTTDAYKTIRSMEHPLAIYIFSADQAEIDEILNNTNSGGVTINDVIMHASVPNAPFGGVGSSGHGYYHGQYGFLAFTHLRTVVAPPGWLEKLIGFRYPPYNMKNLATLVAKNTLGFKKGETMEDQKIGMSRAGRGKIWKVAVLVTGIGILIDYKMNGKLRWNTA